MRRTVSCWVTAQVVEPTTVELQVAVADPATESLRVALDGVQQQCVEQPGPGRGRLHRLDVAPGWLDVRYEAEVLGRADAEVPTATDRSTYLRPSRYCESDRLGPIARAEFAHLDDPADLVRAVAAWVGTRLTYVPGSSEGTDGAVDTLLAQVGVCRDYAHLTIALLRARDVPARLVSVYAPGLWPMDFHAVVEAIVGDEWMLVDPTLMAPRTTMVRIATGRDAADTAFLSTYGGEIRFDGLTVTALVDGMLPLDDLREKASLG